jgi:hypothetical protein
MPFYLVWLEGEDGRRHLFDRDPIEAESQEEALKIVMGGSPELFCLLMGYQKK